MTWLTRWLASRLSPADREAVLGDATERGTPPLRDVVSVLLWHEARAWKTTSPWMALVTLVLPLGFVLSVVSRYWASGFAIVFSIYASNWTSEYLANAGARADLLSFIGGASLHVLCLVLWSWTIGRTLRLISGGALVSTVLLLTGVVLAGTVGSTTTGLLNPFNANVFSSDFYRRGIPLIGRVACVLVPIWSGASSSSWRWVGVGSVASAVAIGTTVKWVAGALMFGWVNAAMWGTPQQHLSIPVPRFHEWTVLVLPLTLAWPAAYLLIQARRERLGSA